MQKVPEHIRLQRIAAYERSKLARNSKAPAPISSNSNSPLRPGSSAIAAGRGMSLSYAGIRTGRAAPPTEPEDFALEPATVPAELLAAARDTE